METLKELRARHLREERELLRAALKATGWNVSRAAALLGVVLSSMQRAIARHPELHAQQVRLGPGPGHPYPSRGRARADGSGASARGRASGKARPARTRGR